MTETQRESNMATAFERDREPRETVDVPTSLRSKTFAEGSVSGKETLSTSEQPRAVPSPPTETQLLYETWLVGVDDRHGCEWALNHTLNSMNRERDHLILLAVTNRKVTDEHLSRDVLLKFARRAERLGVKNWRLILRCALTDVPKALVDAASEFNADYIVLGQEKSKKHDQHSIFSSTPGITKYCISHAPCTVAVVQHETKLSDELTKMLFGPKTELGKEEAVDAVVERIEKHFLVNNRIYPVEIRM